MSATTAAHPGHPHHAATTPASHEAPDAWHDHSHDTEQPMHGHAEVSNASKIILTGLGLFLMIVVACVVVYGYYTHYTTEQLALRERTSSIAPATDARNYKYQSITTQVKGGKHVLPALEVGKPSLEPLQGSLAEAKASVLKDYSISVK